MSTAHSTLPRPEPSQGLAALAAAFVRELNRVSQAMVFAHYARPWEQTPPREK